MTSSTSSKMDEKLRNAALRGDVEYLKKCAESNKPIEYYLTFFAGEENQSGRGHHGNIFHMAAMENQEEFIREAMGILPQEAKQQLLLQPREPWKFNPLHVAVCNGNVEIVKMFLDVYRCLPSHLSEQERPWLMKDIDGDNPCYMAVSNSQEECALEIYKMDTELISNMPCRGNSLVFLATYKKMRKFALEILRSPHPITCNDITYLDKEDVKWIVNEAQEFIIEILDKTFELGWPSWFIEAILEKDPYVVNRAPLAWIKACKNGHVSTLSAFINHDPGAFRDLCIEHKDSPLHHIQLPSLTKYEEFLKISRMKDLINLQNSEGATPLHIAVQKRNKFLAETLLSMDKIAYNIKNKDQKTAIDLLAQVCEQDIAWEEMCQRIGFDPKMKTSYFQHRTNLLEVRNSLFVVAALLATITFTAGFTLPGGLNQESGEALLSKKVAFLVFLMSNTLAMCTSMLVLICLVWSMVQDSSNKSLLLIDRSVWILMVAFYSTLLAFMTGVYVVIYPKVLWAAIIILIMCSLLVISASRTLLYKVLRISSAKKKQKSERLNVSA